MKKLITVCALAVFVCGSVFAADVAAGMNDQVTLQRAANQDVIAQDYAAAKKLVDKVFGNEFGKISTELKKMLTEAPELIFNASTQESETKLQNYCASIVHYVKAVEGIKANSVSTDTKRDCDALVVKLNNLRSDMEMALSKNKQVAELIRLREIDNAHVTAKFASANAGTAAVVASVQANADEIDAIQNEYDAHFLLQEKDIVVIKRNKAGKMIVVYKAHFKSYTAPIQITEKTRSKDGKFWIIKFERVNDRATAGQIVTALVPMAETNKSVIHATVTNVEIVAPEDPDAAACNPLNANATAKEAKKLAENNQESLKAMTPVVNQAASSAADAQNRLDALQNANLKKNRWGYGSYVPMSKYVPARND